jgi:hypothetical protein
MKIVFLDIDGVLNSHRTAVAFGGYPFEVDGKDRAMFDEVALSLIRGIIQTAGASVVLSSSWRITHAWEKVGKCLDLPIIDKTPSLPGNRGSEIAWWLAKHPKVESYAILDDSPDMLDSQKPCFVQTTMEDGFTWRDAMKLAALMGIEIYDVNHPRLKTPSPAVKLAWE